MIARPQKAGIPPGPRTWKEGAPHPRHGEGRGPRPKTRGESKRGGLGVPRVRPNGENPHRPGGRGLQTQKKPRGTGPGGEEQR